jgi:hypothetical protein
MSTQRVSITHSLPGQGSIVSGDLLGHRDQHFAITCDTDHGGDNKGLGTLSEHCTDARVRREHCNAPEALQHVGCKELTSIWANVVATQPQSSKA